MKKLSVMLMCVLVSSLTWGGLVWEDDMSSLGPWSESSEASPEEGDSVGGIRVVEGNRVQMNSYWDAAKRTNMWRGTGVTIQDEMNYILTVSIQSYKSSDIKNVTVNMQNVTDGWSVIVAEAVTPSTAGFTDYTISFTTIGTANDGAIGDQIGIGINAGWWNNVGIDHVSITEVPEPATLVLLALGSVMTLKRRR